jgi:hypothetical protein
MNMLDTIWLITRLYCACTNRLQAYSELSSAGFNCCSLCLLGLVETGFGTGGISVDGKSKTEREGERVFSRIYLVIPPHCSLFIQNIIKF